MRLIALAAALAVGLCGAVEAKSTHHHYVRYSRAYVGGSSSDYYTNVSGRSVHRPVFTGHRPSGASARCGDGSYSFSQHHQGTCSHHGGVSAWY